MDCLDVTQIADKYRVLEYSGKTFGSIKCREFLD